MLSISLIVFQSFPLLRVLSLSLYPFFGGGGIIFVLLITNFLSSLYILNISPLSNVGLMKIFSHSVVCCFVLLTTSFASQKLLSFKKSHLLIASLSVCATGVIFRKWSPVPMFSSVLPNFSSMRFSVVGFMCKSLIYLDLSFVHGDRCGPIFILLYIVTRLWFTW